MQPTPSHSTEEVPFSFSELFFSRTDARGIILSGNKVFQRISMYSWEELFQKPHRIIRHPDMPKAVFWLLWDTIKQGQPIGAYVKNRAKDGRHYWVFAVVTPIDDGYLSVRLKPGSAILPVVEREYLALTALERERDLKPPESAALLLDRIRQLGFADYGAFMAKALSQELATRNDQLNREHDRSLDCFDQLTESSQVLLTESDEIFRAFLESKYAPLNLRVQSMQLAQDGTTIGVISENYSAVSSEIQDGIKEFMDAAKRVTETIQTGVFLTCVSKIQREVVAVFRQEAIDGDASFEQEMSRLDRQQHHYRQKAIEGLRDIAAQVERFHEVCTAMKRLAAGLEVARIMGKVEAARLSIANTNLSKLFDELATFQTTIAKDLKEIEKTNHFIKRNVQQLVSASASH